MNEKTYRVEYLVVFDSSQGFCVSLDGFKNFLSSHEDLTLTKQKIKFQDEEYAYDVDHGTIGGNEETYFHLKVDFKEENKISKKLLHLLQESLSKASVSNVETLRDDFSRERSEQAYPLLYEVENLMRKLITKFMRINVGMHWIKEAIPDKAEARPRGEETDEQLSYVHNYDFIELSGVFFTEYVDKGARRFLKKIKEASVIEDLEMEDVQALIPRSNWDRYFSELIDCDSHTFQKLWKRLYKLRCKVAHNQLLSHSEYGELKQKCNDAREILLSALNKLDQVQIEETEKETIIQSQSLTSFARLNATMTQWEEMNKQRNLALNNISKQMAGFASIQKQMAPLKGLNLGVDLSQFHGLTGLAKIASQSYPMGLAGLFQNQNTLTRFCGNAEEQDDDE